MLRDIVSTNSTWTEWIGRVRTEYATRFGMVRREVLDEDGRPRTAWVPCDAACPPVRTDAEEVRYETCVLDLIEEVDARSGYELAQWRQLGEAATSRSQRVIVETMLGAYRTRAGEERAAWGRERAAVQREAFDRLSGDEVRAEMIRNVCDELPHGVGGRTEAQWRARLAQALERRRREVREASAQQRSGELHAAKDSEERASAMSGVAHDEAQALAWALPALVVDALRDAGAPQWDAFVDRARAERVRFLGAPSAFGATTTFLQVLDGFEAMVRVIGGDGVARATPNPIASADVVLEALFRVRAVRAGEDEHRGHDERAHARTAQGAWEGRVHRRVGEDTGAGRAVRHDVPLRRRPALRAGAPRTSMPYAFSRLGLEPILSFGCDSGAGAKGAAPRGATLLDSREAVANADPSPGMMSVCQPSRSGASPASLSPDRVDTAAFDRKPSAPCHSLVTRHDTVSGSCSCAASTGRRAALPTSDSRRRNARDDERRRFATRQAVRSHVLTLPQTDFIDSRSC